MAFDIDAFAAEMHSVGFARSSDFEVHISGDILSKVGSSFGLSSALSFRINAATMPARSITDITYSDYGAPYKMGGAPNYIPIDMQIICSPNLREREFFMRWQDLIGGMHRNGDFNATQGQNQFDIGYYDDYVAKQGITIYQLDQQGFQTYAVDLMDAFPSFIGSLNYSWSSVEAQTMNVTFMYRYFQERNQSKLGTQLRIGRDGLQIAGGLNIPFSIEGIKNQARTKLNPRSIISGLTKKYGISFTGLPKFPGF
jgi:hypothetical protein